MDLKIYERTRYQNIYRHKKNKNYVVMISKPVKTSISQISKEKILSIEEAIKIRDNYLIKQSLEIKKQKDDTFKTQWEYYMKYCIEDKKISFNTLKKKKNLYSKYLSYFDDKRIRKISKEEILAYFNLLNTTDKQKNEILKILKVFLNWCVDKEMIYRSPAKGINNIRVKKAEMKYWVADEFVAFMNYINSIDTFYAKMIRILVLIGFNLGDRIGETRALTWSGIDKEHLTININHSINYDTKSKDWLSSTKTISSERVIDVSEKLIKELEDYKNYLQTLYPELNDIIFYNYKLKKPYSDTNLRKHFYKFCDEAKVKRIRLYDLRHTYVTLMMSEGWQLYHISKKLGHKNFSTTVDKYGHIENTTRKEIAKTTDKYF